MLAATVTPGIPRADLRRLYAEHIARLLDETGRALEETGWGAVVIHSGLPAHRSGFDDQDWPLRPTPHFQHWLPLAVADCAVLVRPGRRPTLLHNTAGSYWEGRPAPESDVFWDAFDVVDVADPERVKDLLPAGVKLAFIGDDGERAARWGFEPAARNPADLLGHLDRTRVEKSAYEIECMAEAARRGAIGHRQVFEAFRAGDRSELELHLMFLLATGQDDAETPYKNIMALGPHAAVLHHVVYDRQRTGAADQSLLVDAGATYLGYQCDITRTAVKGSGAAAGVFGEMVRRMDALQQEVCARARIGLPFEELHDQTHWLLAPILRDVGLVHASDEEMVKGGLTRKFLPHGLGHSLGVQTHDVGCRLSPPKKENPFLRNTTVIAAGQVFTIEPGCYFIGALMDEVRAGPLAARVDWRLLDSLRPFGGIRIEDNIAVGATENRNLTRPHVGLV